MRFFRGEQTTPRKNIQLRTRQSLFSTNNKKAQQDAEIVAQLAATFDDTYDQQTPSAQDPPAAKTAARQEAPPDQPTNLCRKPEVGKVAKDVQKKRPQSQYLEGLLRVAKLRHAEREAIKEAMVQKEREDEDPSLKEKPVYVTKGYMRRLKEREAAIHELQAGSSNTHK
ncbi:hypothetical protein GNI_156540 [Gregarina niphandrodes]|uniref:Nuclear speckle splicing regulatory protein 1 N-terminal domain-containing protein n=1 Tax=Gregarina niphandrodes TaxID=110365 RepID=A0A023B010_GRENI|nr:hypothetical protein GNI_156540 [Gregarina niphandrodes]EZG43886.1 hypothetical protein GNI_156540 [Gregarina niphandrodes]|eukprot:XP_011132929.1 hypothetical protein GNI_156540 [Gregarina niphandrodes]